MTDEEATKALLHLTQIWWQRELPDPTLQVWKREIAPRDFETAMATINTLGRQKDFWPSFAEFAKVYVELAPQLSTPRNLEFIHHDDGSVTRIVDGVVVN